MNASSDEMWEELADVTWLMGYLTGVAVESDSDFLKIPDTEYINRWVDNYCAQHPGHYLGTASTQFHHTLLEKSHQYNVSR